MAWPMLCESTEQLPVRLSEAEVLEAARSLEKKLAEQDTVEAEAAHVKATYKAKIGMIEDAALDLRNQIRTGEARREVPVIVIAHFDDNTARTIRRDTGEEIVERRRALTGIERQGSLPIMREAETTASEDETVTGATPEAETVPQSEMPTAEEMPTPEAAPPTEAQPKRPRSHKRHAPPF